MAVKFLNGIDVEGSMNLQSSDIPNLDASKITSGTLSVDRIPNLSGVYQPVGEYLTLETANTTFQPLGNYLTGISSADVTAALGYVPYQEGTALSAYTINFANIEKTNIDLDGEMGWDANDTDAPATLGTYGSSYPDGLYLRGSGTLYTVYHTGHFSGTNIANWQTAYGWGNHASQGYLTSLPNHNHDTLYDAIGSADAVGQQVNERIDTEVFDAINSKQPAGNYFTDGDTVLNMANNDGLVYNDTNNTMYIKKDGTNYAIIDAGGGTITGSLNMTGGGTKISMNNGDIVGVNQLKINDPGEGIVWNNGSSGDITLAVVDDASDNRLNLAGTNASLSINNAVVATQSWVSGQGYLTSIPSTYATESYVNTAISNLVDSSPAALNTLNELAAALGDDANFSTTVANNIGAIDTRINDEVIPYIDAVAGDASNGVTAYGWGNHASAGYLTSVPSALSLTSLTIGSGVTLRESTDRADLLSINSGTSGWGGLQITNNNGDGIWSFMVDGSAAGIYDDQNGDWAIYCVENSYVELRHNGSGKLATNSGGVTVTGTVTATGGNSGNWNTAYGWGNHASAGYLTSIPSDYVRQGQDIVSGNIHPLGDREQLLGLDTNRWQVVFCEILDSAGQHEKNLQNPAGETSVAEYATGTVMVWENGKNVPCTTYANHMRMGIAVENVDSPMIQGAEPVLVTGNVSEGDYLVTSTTTGHAVAVSRDTVKQEQLWDCVIGKALEGGEGESHLIKTWVTI